MRDYQKFSAGTVSLDCTENSDEFSYTVCVCVCVYFPVSEENFSPDETNYVLPDKVLMSLTNVPISLLLFQPSSHSATGSSIKIIILNQVILILNQFKKLINHIILNQFKTLQTLPNALRIHIKVFQIYCSFVSRFHYYKNTATVFFRSVLKRGICRLNIVQNMQNFGTYYHIVLNGFINLHFRNIWKCLFFQHPHQHKVLSSLKIKSYLVRCIVYCIFPVWLEHSEWCGNLSRVFWDKVGERSSDQIMRAVLVI